MIRRIQLALFVVAGVTAAWVAYGSVRAAVYREVNIARIENAPVPAPLPEATVVVADPNAADEDDGLGPDGVVGVLEIPRLKFSEVVASGEDDKTLKVAIGHLLDSPLPWAQGNSVLAAHRDTHFRPLRDIQHGDLVRLKTRKGIFEYSVEGHDDRCADRRVGHGALRGTTAHARHLLSLQLCRLCAATIHRPSRRPLELTRDRVSMSLESEFGQIDIYWFDQILRGRVGSRDKVVDAGCGFGRNLVYLMREGWQVFGLDQDVEVIAEVQASGADAARQRCRQKISARNRWNDRHSPMDSPPSS